MQSMFGGLKIIFCHRAQNIDWLIRHLSTEWCSLAVTTMCLHIIIELLQSCHVFPAYKLIFMTLREYASCHNILFMQYLTDAKPSNLCPVSESTGTVYVAWEQWHAHAARQTRCALCRCAIACTVFTQWHINLLAKCTCWLPYGGVPHKPILGRFVDMYLEVSQIKSSVFIVRKQQKANFVSLYMKCSQLPWEWERCWQS